MKFGISTSSIEVDFFVQLKKLSSKFEVVELALMDVYLEENKIEKIKKILKNNLTCIHCPIVDVNLCSPNKGIREESIRQVKKSIDIANRLEANPVNVHFGRLPAFSASSEELEEIDKKTKQIYFQLGIEALKELVGYSKSKNIDLCVENMPKVYTEFCYSYKEIEKVLNEIDILFTLDLGHANTVDPNLSFKLINSFSSRLRHLHLHDNNGKWDQHNKLGAGNISWDKIYKKLKEVGYSKYVIFELSYDDTLESLNTFI